MEAYFATLEADRMETLGKPLPEGFANSLLTDSKKEMDATLAAVSGAREALAAISVPVAVASSSGPERLRFKLQKTGLIGAFDPHVYSGEEVKNGKPAPDLYLHAAEQLKIPAVACVAIEDSVHGVVSAKTAGMTVIGFTGGGHCRTGHGDYLRDSGADVIVGQMDDLSAALDSLS